MRRYTPNLLDYFVWMTGAGAMAAYICYTMAAETVELHDWYALVATIPFVVLGLGRYLMRYLGCSGNAARALTGDRVLQGPCLGWLATVLVAIA